MSFQIDHVNTNIGKTTFNNTPNTKRNGKENSRKMEKKPLLVLSMITIQRVSRTVEKRMSHDTIGTPYRGWTLLSDLHNEDNLEIK